MSNRAMAWVAALAVTLGGASLVLAGGEPADKGPSLAPGDAAPKLAITEWVKGDAVDHFEKGKVYVVELWATWCGPCMQSMEHLSQVQKDHPDDVVVLAVNVFERVDGADRSERVRNTTNAMGARMGMRVGIDGTREMEKTWYGAADRHGIPSSFIVDQNGMIAWIGHPNQLDPVLRGVLTGSWNLPAARRVYLEGLAQTTTLTPQAQQRLRERTLRLQEMYKVLNAGDYEGFDRLAKGLVASDLRDDDVQLNALAWRIATDTNTEKRDLDLALTASQRACEITDWKDPYALDTYARVLWERGDHAGALDWERKAVAALGKDAPDKLRSQVLAALDRYEAAAEQQRKSDPADGG